MQLHILIRTPKNHTKFRLINTFYNTTVETNVLNLKNNHVTP